MMARTRILLLCLILLPGAAAAQPAQPPAAEAPGGGTFEKVVIEDELTNPMELAVAPDGRVFFIERDGAVRVWHPQVDSTTMVGYVPTFAIHNEGMMGLALDPHFEENGWLYVYHTPIGKATKNRLVRYTVVGNRFERESREVLLEVPTQRQMCCHSGGSIAFGPEGHLFIATGDNTNPADVNFYAPLDERPGHAFWDAQRTAGNTRDLRGKILRIRPKADGTYTIPDGNLFSDGRRGRPEIYVMGVRNAYRISIDQETGCLYWGDVGPGPAAGSEKRGPVGYDEINRACEAGNYGWPYFVGDNAPYRAYDFATKTSGAFFDPDRPVNDSPNNTGTRVLPPAQPALIWYPHTKSNTFPELGVGGQTAMAGPVYHYDPDRAGTRGLPAAYDGHLFIYDFMRNWIKDVTLASDGAIQEITPFAAELAFMRPMDLETGPGGRLYLIEWGTRYGGYNEDDQIVRLDYYGSEQPPASGGDARETAARETSASPASSDAAREGGRRLSIEEPVQGGFIEMSQPVPYRVRAAGGDSASGQAVIMQPYLGHDTHLHALERDTGRVGTVRIRPDSSHAPYIEDRFVLLEARYAEARPAKTGPPGGPRAHVVLQPKHKEAEHTASLQGAERKITGDIRRRSGVETFLVAGDGDYASYRPINLAGIRSVTFRVAAEARSTIELRLDGPEGPLIGEAQVVPPEKPPAADTTDTLRWTRVEGAVSDPGGTHALFLVFRGATDGTLLQLDWMRFNGPGVRPEER